MSLLVIGGARSGKSRYAQGVAESLCDGGALVPIYLATAQAWDAEMAERIALHRMDRDARWQTRDVPLDLAGALRDEARPGRVVLVDCLTLWLSNRMLAGDDIDAATAHLAAAIGGLETPAVLVSNEVGGGIVPETPLGRRFRDAQGRLNQTVAAACSHVVLVCAGLPMQLKPRDPPAVWTATRPVN